ncbi:hypothetical protein EYR38_007562 [Pleurotus pulmonarius]|nr:hypothetical protein EYR38_007562 [Pleurotus pulmonarius]
MTCSRAVFRCFKSLERLGDRITGAAGPYFVGLAVILIGIGTICFFDVVLPGLQWPLISWPLCIIIALNLHMHYFYVCTVPPGFVEDPPRSVPESFLWAKKPQRKRALTSGVSWSSGDSVKITKAEPSKCRKCGTRPELGPSHFNITQGINQCVGIHNERHFVLFMYVTSFQSNFPNLNECETTVETHDHEHYSKLASSRGEDFVNSYDLGKIMNLKLFFNVWEGGYSLTTLLLPLRVPPYSDGWHWARRPGYEHHYGLKIGEEFTDEEEEEE